MLKSRKKIAWVEQEVNHADAPVRMRIAYPDLIDPTLPRHLGAIPVVSVEAQIKGEDVETSYTLDERAPENIFVPARYLAHVAGYKRIAAMIRDVEKRAEADGEPLREVEHYLTVNNPSPELLCDEIGDNVRVITLLNPEGLEKAFEYATFLNRHRESLTAWYDRVVEGITGRAIAFEPLPEPEEEGLSLPSYSTPEEGPQDESAFAQMKGVKSLPMRELSASSLLEHVAADRAARATTASRTPAPTVDSVPVGAALQTFADLISQAGESSEQVERLARKVEEHGRRIETMQREWQQTCTVLRELGEKLIELATFEPPPPSTRREIERLVRKEAMQAKDIAERRRGRELTREETHDIFSQTWDKLDREFYSRTGTRLKARVKAAANRGEKKTRLDIAQERDVLDVLHSVAHNLFS